MASGSGGGGKGGSVKGSKGRYGTNKKPSARAEAAATARLRAESVF